MHLHQTFDGRHVPGRNLSWLASISGDAGMRCTNIIPVSVFDQGAINWPMPVITCLALTTMSANLLYCPAMQHTMLVIEELELYIYLYYKVVSGSVCMFPHISVNFTCMGLTVCSHA